MPDLASRGTSIFDKSFILKVASGIYGVFDTKYKGLYEDLHEVLYEQKESHDLAL